MKAITKRGDLTTAHPHGLRLGNLICVGEQCVRVVKVIDARNLVVRPPRWYDRLALFLLRLTE